MNLSAGLSGCHLELIEDRIIRKYSTSNDYNKRLLSQAQKQILFSQRIFKNIDTPKIYDIGDNYFDMEYISGHNFLDFFLTSSINDVEFIIDTLFYYFDSLLSNYQNINIQSNILNKVGDLREKSEYKNYLQNIEKFVKSNNTFVPKTLCHGDLTFTNIIFHKNRLFFIDFLDSYIDSFVCDLVKLKQDLYYLWSIKVQKIQSNRLEQIYKHIWKKLSQRYSEFINSDVFDVIDAMNMIRIEPYLTSSHQRTILEIIIKSTKLYENFSSSYGGTI